MTSRTRTGAQILVDQLIVHGATVGFGVPGESYLAVLDAMYGVGDRFRFIVCRHEANAANMAEAAGKLTGAPGLCFVTRGPGATHASSGMHNGRQDSTPMILFIGQVATDFIGREAFQEVDYGKMFSELSKLVVVLDNPHRIPELISRAFHAAVNGRPGPVVVVLPEDVLTQISDVVDARPYKRAEAAPTPAAMQELAEHIAKAQRPLMMVGGQGWTPQAKADIVRFAEAWNLPVAANFRRQDIVDNRHALYIGEVGLGVNPALAQAIKDTDLLIAVGPRMSEATTSGYELIDIPTPRQALVHVHLDPNELGRVYHSVLPIVAGPGPFSAAAAALQPSGPPQYAAWTEKLRHNYVAYNTPEPQGEETDLGQIVSGLSKRLPDNAIICNGAGNYTTWVHRYFQYRPTGAQLAPTSGAMAYGFPAGIAAKVIRPDAPVVVFAGDGCFLMSAQDLATAVRYNLAMVIIVINNGSYGTIRMHQERHFPGRVFGTDLNNPDFVAMAQSFGAYGELVEDGDDFWAAYERAAAFGGPALLEVRTGLEKLTPRIRLSALRAPLKAGT